MRKSVTFLQIKKTDSRRADAADVLRDGLDTVFEGGADDLLSAWQSRTGSIISGGNDSLHHSSTQLAALVISAKLKPFLKVKAAMDKLAAELKKQQKEEVLFKTTCNKDFDGNEKAVYKKKDQKGDLEATMKSLGAQMDTLSKEIAVNNKQVADTQTAMKKASQNREAENKAFQRVVADQRATQDILKKALAKLTAFYKKKSFAQLDEDQEQAPPVQFTKRKNSGGASPVMGMIEQIIEDSVRLEKESMSGEKKAQAEYEKFIKDSNTVVKALSASTTAKTKARADAKSKNASAKGDLQSTIGQLASLAKVAEVVGEGFGSFQDFECRQLKEKLMNMEYRGTGRVKLSDFYKPALNGSWTFQESAGYLRSLGLLDESDPKEPSVMIANYVTSHANCIASSGFYSVCCKNECEGLLGHLEQSIGTSEAKPAAIADLIANLASSTVTAPLKLSASLRQRLDDIAGTHRGMVPLHGRLFAQWMHHVYPRECPYPHVSGTADSKLADEWMQESGSDARASEEEMKQFVEQSANTATKEEAKYDLPVEDLMPWSSEEELFVVRPLSHLPASSTPPAAMRSMMLFAAAGSLAFGLIQTLKTSSPLGQSSVPLKYTI